MKDLKKLSINLLIGLTLGTVATTHDSITQQAEFQGSDERLYMQNITDNTDSSKEKEDMRKAIKIFAGVFLGCSYLLAYKLYKLTKLKTREIERDNEIARRLLALRQLEERENENYIITDVYTQDIIELNSFMQIAILNFRVLRT